jgi:hypothetical protein
VRRRLVPVIAAAGILLAACGSHPKSTATIHVGVTQILRKSRAAVDATPAVHFALASSGIASGTTALVSGSGDLKRPDELQGSMLVAEDGISATIKVVATGGRFYALLPFASKYAVANPASYGLGNPAQLLSPTDGVSSLLTSMQSPKLGASQRIDGELLDVVTGTVPGRDVPVITDLDKAEPVTITAYVSPSTYQLRRVQLAGPFTKAGVVTTYDVTLTHYGESVTISTPPT